MPSDDSPPASLEELEVRLSAERGKQVRWANQLKEWERFAAALGHGYSLTNYDYDNDLSVRATLQLFLDGSRGALRNKLEEMIAAADESFEAATVQHWRALRGRPEWWWSRIPAKRGPEFGE